MEVILREDVPNLGTIGDTVRVKPGFARNYLLPRGLAVLADHRNVHVLEHQQRLATEKREQVRRQATSVAEKLSCVRLTIKARAGDEGKLFGSVTNIDIERALGTAGYAVDRRRIRLPDPIKSVGVYTVPVHLGVGVDAQVSITVEAEE